MSKETQPNRSGLAPGYGIIHTKVLTDKNLDPLTKLVYAYLSSRQGLGSNFCYPSYPTIARELGISKAKVITSIKLLEVNNWLKKERRVKESGKDTSNRYYVLYPSADEHYTDDKGLPDRRVYEVDRGSLGNRPLKSLPDRPKQNHNNNTTQQTIAFKTQREYKAEKELEKNISKLREELGHKYIYSNDKTVYISMVPDNEYEKLLSSSREKGITLKRKANV